jgi:hypothetical protein
MGSIDLCVKYCGFAACSAPQAETLDLLRLIRLRRRANNDALKHDVTYVSTLAIAALTACLAGYAVLIAGSQIY